MQAVKYNYAKVFQIEAGIITSGNTTTGIISCGGMQLRGIYLPGNWTTSNISFNGSPDGTNFYTCKGLDGTALSIANVSSGFLPLLPYLFDACPYIQIVAGAQSQTVTVYAALMPIYQGIHN